MRTPTCTMSTISMSTRPVIRLASRIPMPIGMSD